MDDFDDISCEEFFDDENEFQPVGLNVRPEVGQIYLDNLFIFFE